MVLPFAKSQSYLGIDLGATSIKLVELKRKGADIHLVTYGYVERVSSDIARNKSKELREKVVNLVKKLCKASRTTSRKVVTGLPSFSAFISVLSLPAQSKERLEANIKREAAKLLPIPAEEAILDWKILKEGKLLDMKSAEKEIFTPIAPEGEKKEPAVPKEEVAIPGAKAKSKKNLSILLTVAPRDLVARYVDVFKGTGLELLSLETEGFALVRALVGRDPARLLIVDISATTCDVILVEKGMPLSNRTVNIGGLTLTRKLAEKLNLDFEGAEQFKRDLANRTKQLPDILKEELKPIVNELNHLISQQNKIALIEKVVLSGGSAFLPGLAEFLAEKLNIKVIIGDPWARIVYPTELRPLLDELAPRFGVAVGLALREVEK
jgi:type IV pilus assembly protein PilM